MSQIQLTKFYENCATEGHPHMWRACCVYLCPSFIGLIFMKLCENYITGDIKRCNLLHSLITLQRLRERARQERR